MAPLSQYHIQLEWGIIQVTRKNEMEVQNISLTSIEKQLKPEIFSFPYFSAVDGCNNHFFFFPVVIDAKLGWPKTVIVRSNHNLLQISAKVNQKIP
jgi:hypothetical protein